MSSVYQGKGRSLIDFPNDYVVLDLETTGLDPYWDEIIEMAAIRVVDGEIAETFQQLVKPYNPVDSFITELTGITNEMLEDKPHIDDVLKSFLDFVGESVVVGHYVNFDINFLIVNSYNILKISFSNDFVDTYRLSRWLLPEMPHHRLKDLIEYYGIEASVSHRALADCQHTNSILALLKEDAVLKHGSVQDFIGYVFKRKKCSYLSAKDITAESDSFDESHILYGKVCVFTGALEKMVRRDAMQLVANVGGINADSVTAKTNYLILGNNDYCKSIKDGKSLKQKKAEKLILEGKDLEVMSESVFYSLFDEL